MKDETNSFVAGTENWHLMPKQISSHCFVATDPMKSEKQTKGGRQKAKMKYNSNVKATGARFPGSII